MARKPSAVLAFLCIVQVVHGGRIPDVIASDATAAAAVLKARDVPTGPLPVVLWHGG
jgi:hypothetical protein